jgi:hypothetical protein
MEAAACGRMFRSSQGGAMETVLTVVALAFVVATILLALWVFVIAPIVIPLRSARR